MGSLSDSSCTIGDLSVDGTQSVGLGQCESEDLTVNRTPEITIKRTAYSSLGADPTTVLIIDKLVGSVVFANETSKTVLLPLPYPNSSYMVLVDCYSGEHPFVSNKTTTSFDIEFSGNQTVTPIYQVLKQ